MNSNQRNIHSYDSINDQENADLLCELQDDSFPHESFHEQSPSHLDSTQCSDYISPGPVSFYNQPTDISDDILRQNVRYQNVHQCHAYNTFLCWCCNTMKNLNSLQPIKIEPIYLFITGGDGAGKSHLIKTIYHTAVKTFRHPLLTLSIQLYY